MALLVALIAVSTPLATWIHDAANPPNSKIEFSVASLDTENNGGLFGLPDTDGVFYVTVSNNGELPGEVVGFAEFEFANLFTMQLVMDDEDRYIPQGQKRGRFAANWYLSDSWRDREDKSKETFLKLYRDFDAQLRSGAGRQIIVAEIDVRNYDGTTVSKEMKAPLADLVYAMMSEISECKKIPSSRKIGSDVKMIASKFDACLIM